MEYMTCPEAAKKWGLSERRVQILCAGNRIPGVSKLGYMWLIPKDAEKSADARSKNNKNMIETKRLILRKMSENDFSALYTVLADSDIMKHYPYTFDDARVRNWIKVNMERYRIFGFGLWALCLKDTGEMIGDCGLTMQSINGLIRPEIGYHIRKDKQRNGYATEAAKAVRDWAFENTPFQVLYSYMTAENIPSIKTAKAYGCRLVDEYENEQNELVSVYAISKSEWDGK